VHNKHAAANHEHVSSQDSTPAFAKRLSPWYELNCPVPSSQACLRTRPSDGGPSISLDCVCVRKIMRQLLRFAECEVLIAEYFNENMVRQGYLLTHAGKI
jgi:hypothetical protein